MSIATCFKNLGMWKACIVAFVFLLVATPNAALCSSKEENALLAFKNGDEQRKQRLSTWMQGTDCCQWQGISCTNGRVTELKLQSSELPGKLSPELANLLELQFFDLSDNGLEGSIPSTFERLLKLQVLNVGNNFMSGALPSSLDKLSSNLKVLDLTRHRFQGSLSPVIGKLASLEQLILESSDVSTSMPSFIGNLGNLKLLNMRGCSFTGSISTSLSQLTRLETLDLSDCTRLTGSIPASLGKLSNLESLDLSGTFISGSIPSSLGSLTKLKFLNLNIFRLSGSLPKELGNLVSLENLSIVNTRVSGEIPESLGSLKHLKSLDLSANPGLRGTIPVTLGRLAALEKLDLYGCGLSGTIPNSFGQLQSLVTLSLSGNALSGPIPESLGMLENLDSLLAAGNLLSGRIPEGFSRSLRNLTIMQLVNNSITGLPTNMKNMVKLQSVYLDANHLSFEAISGLSTLPKLSILSLSNCNLQGKIPKWLENIDLKPNDGQTILDLSSNSITGGVPSGFGKMSSLTRLFLQSNKLEGMVPDTYGQGLKQLAYLDLSSNYITGLPSKLDSLGANSLYSINLQNTNLSFSAISGLQTLSQVSLLKLDNSQLEGLIPSWFSNIRMVQGRGDRDAVLTMSFNKISGQIPKELSNLTSITTLELHANNLLGPIPSTLSKMTSLQRLDLSMNRLSGGIPQELTELKNLNYFNVSSNQLNGPIPQMQPFISLDPSSYANNAGLCGKPLPPC